MSNLNWPQITALGAGILTVLAALYLGVTGAIQWDVALPILLAGLAALGIHPALNGLSS